MHRRDGIYSHGTLLKSIQNGIIQLGKTVDNVTIHDFAPVDEFHIGGRKAIEHLVTQLDLTADDHVLDVGCGLGGAARFMADRFGCRVTGIDLTEEYVQTGTAINRWVGLDDRIDLRQGSALALPFEAATFDVGYMIHVGMNIADKRGLFVGICRVLRAGVRFGVYDVMKVGDGEVTYPLPWADVEAMSFLGTPHEYEEALRSAGFEVVTINDRRDDALDFFEALQGRSAVHGTTPPHGMDTLMGANESANVKNVIENIVSGLIAPVEIIACKV